MNTSTLLQRSVAIMSTSFFLLSTANADTISANEPKMRPFFDKCMGASDGVTVNMLNCIANENKYQDRRLNRAYKKLMRLSGPREKTELRAHERKWLTERKIRCAPDPDGGTAATLNSQSCYLSETAKQASYLETTRRKNGR